MPATLIDRRPVQCRVLRDYLRGLPPVDREPFAIRCGTTLKYLLQVAYGGKSANAELAMLLDWQSGGRVPAEQVRPDLAMVWQHLRCGCVLVQ